MKRDGYKFLSGSAAALAYVHAAYAVAASKGIMNRRLRAAGDSDSLLSVRVLAYT